MPLKTTWQQLLSEEKPKPYFKKITQFLKDERTRGKIIYPNEKDLFSAIESTPFEKVKVVIIGQDPYHNLGQAHGLAFSVQKGIRPPPSLKNIYKELQADCGITPPEHGHLKKWADQGVLLLNTVLTVEKNKPHGHAKIGWQQFTDKIIETLNQHPKPIVYLLWGAHAQKMQSLIDTKKHHILTAPHPSPLSAHRGFLGCKHFSTTNSLLKKAGREPIDWQI